MKAIIFPVERAGPGRLSTMARPRGGDWLDDEMAALSSEGVSIVVSMLTSSETQELKLGNEEEAARIAGIAFRWLPTADRGTPSVPEFNALLEYLEAELSDGKHIVIHCRMGIGRASLVAAGILIIEGISAAEARSRIARARGLEVPDTPGQKEWLETAVRSSGYR